MPSSAWSSSSSMGHARAWHHLALQQPGSHSYAQRRQVCAVPWMHLSCREKADVHRGASALLMACHVLSEALQTRLRTKEA